MKSWIFQIPFVGYGEPPEEAWEDICEYLADNPDSLWDVFNPDEVPNAERNESGDRCKKQIMEVKNE